MPSPEDLGIAASAPRPQVGVDWTAAKQKLEGMGVKCFRVDRTPAGAISVTLLLLPQGSPPRQVESTAATEAEALSLALVETERCLRERINSTR